ncbi:excalibur calcium-binding domain-containing protein [Methylophilus sp. 5]|uniref:excalibur calcium-binding domain-containing protein n=1 Tax=Methylophilus sp. 5 TaxID=1112274 RepID=UPI0018DEE674|nr:excalibur calcium-binding domain-containing protein [Methylophilus sp. 5]
MNIIKIFLMLILLCIAYVILDSILMPALRSQTPPTLSTMPLRHSHPAMDAPLVMDEPRLHDSFSGDCEGHTHCSQMHSCAEAKQWLSRCPNEKMDGDGDGVPCERQWCQPALH